MATTSSEGQSFGTAVEWLNDPATFTAIRNLSELRGGPHLAVLDTSCVRTGLHHQLSDGLPPRSLRAVRDGTIRLFMEYSTLLETYSHLPRFAEQFGVPQSQLVEMLNRDWLPYISVVKLPDALRRIDQRANAVQTLDPDDYPAAALAALLSPCILLTHDIKHFAPLGVREWAQGTNAVAAAVSIKTGEREYQAVLIVPAAPVIAVGAGVQFAADQFGNAAWLLVPLLIAGGLYLYKRQPPEKRDRIRQVAGDLGRAYLEQASRVAAKVNEAERVLGSCVVPRPERRSPTSAVLRELATASESMSAQQIWDLLDDDVRPSVVRLRTFLHANDSGDPFVEVRRGGFQLGCHYALRAPDAS